jgi:Phosphotransferase enzyme family
VPHTLRFVIPDGSSSVLLVEDGSGWSLPNVSSDEPEIVVGAAPALRDLVGQDVVVLRDVRFGPMPPPEDAVFYLTEPVRDPHAAKGRWWTRTDLRGLDLVEPRDRSALDTWFREEAPGSLQPWQREGWFGTAVAWIGGVLPGVSEVRQFATWCNSCVLRVTSTRGRSWFKAVPTFWASEPAVTAMLAELFPGRTPQVLALESERRWMLLDDLGGEPADLLPVHERMGALEAVGDLHRAGVDRIDELLDGGCLDRRPAVLSTQVAALAADPTVPLPGDLGDRFLAAVPRLQELCTELAASAIPPTLVHGDLHAGNVMRIDGRFVVFDWSDACVADPLVDVLMFVSRLPDDPMLRTTFRDRYLDAWPGVTRSAADAYVVLPEPLAAMHHAVSYRGIYDAFGPGDRWLFAGALPQWIEHALAYPIVAG